MLKAVGRIALALIFIMSGVQHASNFAGTAAMVSGAFAARGFTPLLAPLGDAKLVVDVAAGIATFLTLAGPYVTLHIISTSDIIGDIEPRWHAFSCGVLLRPAAH